MTELNTDQLLTDAEREYVKLCNERDEIEARIAPARKKMEAAANAAEAARIKAMDARAELDQLRGSGWFKLKKRIGQLARIIQSLRPAPTPNEVN